MSKRERIEALEARVAALEASNSPGGLGDAPDNTPGGRCRHVGEPGCDDGRGTEVCRFIDCAFPVTQRRREVSRVIQPDPEPVPQWRALVKLAWVTTGTWPYDSALANVLDHLITVENSGGSGEGCADALARIVAVCEGQVGDGWKADPDGIVLERVVQWLLGPLSRNDWRVLGNRAAAWLRSLTEDEQ